MVLSIKNIEIENSEHEWKIYMRNNYHERRTFHDIKEIMESHKTLKECISALDKYDIKETDEYRDLCLSYKNAVKRIRQVDDNDIDKDIILSKVSLNRNIEGINFTSGEQLLSTAENLMEEEIKDNMNENENIHSLIKIVNNSAIKITNLMSKKHSLNNYNYSM